MLDTANLPMSLLGFFAAVTVVAIVFGSWIFYVFDMNDVRAMLASGRGILLHVDRAGTITPEHAARGKHLPLATLERRAGELPRSRVIVVCSHDAREARAAKRLLRSLGFRVRIIADENLPLLA